MSHTMRNEDFLAILQYIKLPCGTLLRDGVTYRLGKQNFPIDRFSDELDSFDKILVLSDGNNHVVGGVLFYDCYDIQATILPKYRGLGYMSAIHKNGVLTDELYPGQKVSIATDELNCMDDFLMRDHLLQMIGLNAKNLSEVYRWLNMIGKVNCSEKEFISRYSR